MMSHPRGEMALRGAAIVILCLGILMQMLGVTMTLWDPAAPVDTDPVTASLLEDWSIPSSIVPLRFPPRTLPPTGSSASGPALFLDSVPFHPPA